MNPTSTIQEKCFLFLKLFSPMVITQISLFAMTFVSIFLTGQYGTEDLAGVSIGYNIWVSLFTGLLGVLLGISPIMAQSLGANRRENLPRLIQHGLMLSSAMAIGLIILGVLFLDPFLSFLNLPPNVHKVALHYMIGIALSLFPILNVCILRNTVDTHGYTYYSTIIVVISLFVNILANYTFIFGHFGFPAYGGAGAGYAMVTSTWFNFFAYIAVTFFNREIKAYRIFSSFHGFDWLYIREILQVGIPIGIALFCEVSIFSIAAFFMSTYGAEYIAAHQAAISFTNILYCVPLSISMAATITVGYEVGAKRLRDARQYANFARIFALFSAGFVFAFGFKYLREIASIYTSDLNMIGLIAQFLSYALFFSLIDAFGTPIQGILRGYKDVKIITYIAIGTYWGACLPIALYFTKVLDYGPIGIWYGLLGGLLLAGILYTVRLQYMQNRYK